MVRWLRRYGAIVVDPVFALIAIPVAAFSRLVRAFGFEYLPLARKVFEAMGSFPLRRHYYEPLFHPGDLREPLHRPRALPGIDFRRADQLALLEEFAFEAELEAFPVHDTGDGGFFYDNGAFESGDAELWYSMIRHLRPSKVIEVGSGMSTKLAMAAIEAGVEEDPAYRCRHLCIEPYEAPWLEASGVEVLRQRVEEADPGLFEVLGPGDILFIDSSHVIRPQGDVLFLFLDIVPRLRPGVVIHVHDIFSPRDYPTEWVLAGKRFWHEQYLVEALLSGGARLEVMLAANFLAHEEPEALGRRAPVFRRQRSVREPGSIYLRRT